MNQFMPKNKKIEKNKNSNSIQLSPDLIYFANLRKQGYTPLHIYILQNKIEEIKNKINDNNHNISINDQNNPLGFTPLHIAVINENLPVLNLLLRIPSIDLEKKSAEDSTALHYAIQKQNLEIIKLLVAKNVNVNARFKNEPPIFIVIFQSNEKILKFLHEKGLELAVVSTDKFSPLTAAITSKKIRLIEYLLKNGSDLEQKMSRDVISNDGQRMTLIYTPIVFAIEGNDPDVVRILLEYGANVDIKLDHMSLIHYVLALENVCIEIIKLLIEYFVKQNVSIDFPDANGETALIYAIKKNKPEVVTLLLENNAFVNYVVPKVGSTPLHYSVVYGSSFILSALLKCNPNLIEDSYGVTPYWAAVIGKNTQITQMLIDHYKIPDAKLYNMRNESILHFAARLGLDESTLDVFLKNGYDIDHQDFSGTTALMTVVKSFDETLQKKEKVKKKKTIDLLLKTSTITKIDNVQNNVLHWAVLVGYHYAVEQILSKDTSAIFQRNDIDKIPEALLDNDETSKELLTCFLKYNPLINIRTAFDVLEKILRYELSIYENYIYVIRLFFENPADQSSFFYFLNKKMSNILKSDLKIETCILTLNKPLKKHTDELKNIFHEILDIFVESKKETSNELVNKKIESPCASKLAMQLPKSRNNKKHKKNKSKKISAVKPMPNLSEQEQSTGYETRKIPIDINDNKYDPTILKTSTSLINYTFDEPFGNSNKNFVFIEELSSLLNKLEKSNLSSDIIFSAAMTYFILSLEMKFTGLQNDSRKKCLNLNYIYILRIAFRFLSAQFSKETIIKFIYDIKDARIIHIKQNSTFQEMKIKYKEFKAKNNNALINNSRLNKEEFFAILNNSLVLLKDILLIISIRITSEINLHFAAALFNEICTIGEAYQRYNTADYSFILSKSAQFYQNENRNINFLFEITNNTLIDISTKRISQLIDLAKELITEFRSEDLNINNSPSCAL